MNKAQFILSKLKEHKSVSDFSLNMESLLQKDNKFDLHIQQIKDHFGLSSDEVKEKISIGYDISQKVIKEDLRVIAKIAKDDSINSIPIEFVKINTPNAFAIREESDNSYAIGIDYAFIPLFYQVVSVMDDALNCSNQDEMQDKLHNVLTTIVDNIMINFVKGIYVSDYTTRSEKLLSDNILNNKTGLALEQFMRIFIISHEVAHIKLGHFDISESNKLNVTSIDGNNCQISCNERWLEYQADYWAIDILLQLETNPKGVALIGPIIFFYLTSIMNDLITPDSNVGAKIISSHPKPWLRAGIIKQIIKDKFKDYEETDLEYFLFLANMIRDITSTPEFENLIEPIRTYFANKKDGE